MATPDVTDSRSLSSERVQLNSWSSVLSKAEIEEFINPFTVVSISSPVRTVSHG